MQYLNPVLNLPDFDIKSVQGRHLLVFDVSYKGNKQCGHCQSSKVRIKASFMRKVKHHSCLLKTVMMPNQAPPPVR